MVKSKISMFDVSAEEQRFGKMHSAKTRIPKQKRSIVRKKLIKETALMLFSEKGYLNVSTNEIAKAANVSIGSLYSYFPNKKEIYDELVNDLYSFTLGKIIPEDISLLSPFELIKKYIYSIMESHRYLTAFQKEITSLSYQNDDFRRLESPYSTFAVSKILSLLEFYKCELRINDLSAAAFMIHTSIEGIVHELSFFSDKSRDDEKIINEFAEMLYNYLFKEPAPRYEAR